MNQSANKKANKENTSAPTKALYEIIDIKSDLHKKTKMVASLEIAQQKFEEIGTQALSELELQFDDWMEKNFQPLLEVNKKLKDDKFNQKYLDDIYNASHEIKGIALTLGYPLAGKLAFSLCGMIEKLEDPKLIPVSVIDQYTSSIQAIVNNKVKGDGSEIARTLVSKLTEVTTDYVATTLKKIK